MFCQERRRVGGGIGGGSRKGDGDGDGDGDTDGVPGVGRHAIPGTQRTRFGDTPAKREKANTVTVPESCWEVGGGGEEDRIFN